MFRNYLAAALRNLQRNGLYAGLTVMGLAIGFASAILIGLYVRHELTYDQFIPGHERTYIWNQKVMQANKPPLDMDLSSGRLAEDLKLDFPQIEHIARLFTGDFPPAIRHGDVSISERAFGWADPDFFKVLPVPAVAGDPGTALEAPDAVVLSRAGARKYFGRDKPLGDVLLINGHPMRVTAVIENLPSNSNLAGDVFAASTSPFSAMKNLYDAGYSSNSLKTYVRLKPGADVSEINKALPAFLQRRILPALGKIDPDLRFQYAVRLKPITAMHLDPAAGDNGGDAKVVAGIAVIGVLIVIVAAINFVTLMTARASRRAMEVGVRKALGAQRKDLIVQFMGEAFIYVVVAVVFAVALAELLLPAVNAALQRKMVFNYLTDPGLLATILGVTLVTGLLAGLYPALVLSSFRPASVLKGGPIGGGGGGRVRQALVVAQFAVLITLVLSTTTIYRQTLFGLKDATHTNKDNVVMLFASPCTDALRDAVRAVPGVRLAACSSPMAVNLSNSVDVVSFRGHNINLSYAPVDLGFFDVYGIKPVAGRLFSADRPGDDGEHMVDVAPTIVINESGARPGLSKSAGRRRPTGDVALQPDDFDENPHRTHPAWTAVGSHRRGSGFHLRQGALTGRRQLLLCRPQDRHAQLRRSQHQAPAGQRRAQGDRPDLDPDERRPAPAAILRRPVPAAALHRRPDPGRIHRGLRPGRRLDRLPGPVRPVGLYRRAADQGDRRAQGHGGQHLGHIAATAVAVRQAGAAGQCHRLALGLSGHDLVAARLRLSRRTLAADLRGRGGGRGGDRHADGRQPVVVGRPGQTGRGVAL